ncbi:hypothetical protein ACIQC7_18635 [Kitasatospora sp. NPDC088556]|uniref:hypothetical protein n=1 Tax=Kitasatospora sp. NPDC088556 TaxID=3364076 RepID=UPI0037F4D2AB
MSWDLIPGEHIDRTDLHARFGGRIHGRISPSRQSPNVHLFITPDAEASCLDGWTGTHLHFGGEGGLDGTDQTLSQGNRSVAEHEQDGRALRVFLQLHGRPAQYLGQFRLDADVPVVYADAPFDARRPQQVRRAIVFRLLPLNGAPTGLSTADPIAERNTVRPIGTGTGTGTVMRVADPSPAEEAAGRLLRAYESYARWAHQAKLSSYLVTVAGAFTELHVDLYDLTRNELVVARATAARPVVREAIGELHDLARYFDAEPRRVLLLPSPPDEDLTELLHHQQVSAVWPSGPREFARSEVPA